MDQTEVVEGTADGSTAAETEAGLSAEAMAVGGAEADAETGFDVDVDGAEELVEGGSETAAARPQAAMPEPRPWQP